jgi:hypothetical protein
MFVEREHELLLICIITKFLTIKDLTLAEVQLKM